MKRIISVFLCVCMLISGAGCINTCNVYASQKSDQTYCMDYERAFWKGYLSSAYKKQKKTKQITFEEYRGMLRTVIRKQQGDIKTFDQKVKKTDRKLTRGEAIIMSWYAAQALHVTLESYDANEVFAKDSFWDSVSANVLKKEFPTLLKKKSVKDDRGNVWDDEYTAAYLWNVWSSSPYSGIPVVDYDTKKDMQTMKPFLMEDAICAVTRICDGMHWNKKKYVKISDKKAITPTINLKKKGKVKDIEHLPRLTGFVFNAFKSEAEICHKPEDVANVANWGFTSARVMVNYHMLFNQTVDQVDLYQLEKLDELVAAAEHYKIHLNILMYQLPGRESWTDKVFNSGGDFDLFINKEKQKKVCDIWELLAKRYKDVPGDYLSFTPFWEATNKNLSTGAKYKDYTSEDVANTLDQIISVMRKADKDCYILYELSQANDLETLLPESKDGYKKISQKHKNTMISYNYCEMPFVYHNMTATQGHNVDNNNHSMFLPDYPNLIYAAKNYFADDSTTTMDGFLPKGTKITIYLAHADGTFAIKADGKSLYQERFYDQTYETSYLLSTYYPYSTSDKKITVELEQDVSKLSFECSEGWVSWSGMDVTLPKKYAKEKWYSISSYDRYLQGVLDEWGYQFEKRSTSNIMICPNSNECGNHLTIHKDLTYTSEKLRYDVSAKYAKEWGKAVSGLSKNCVIRFENATFSNGTKRAAINKYYETLLSMYDKYGFNWYSNDYEIILEDAYFKMPDAKLVKYGKYEHFNMELLKLLQKHR